MSGHPADAVHQLLAAVSNVHCSEQMLPSAFSSVGMLLVVTAVGAVSTHHALVCLSISIAYKQTNLLSIHYAQIPFINVTGMYKYVRGNPLKALITCTNVTQNENAR